MMVLSQLGSPFFNCPTEIRDAIYSYIVPIPIQMHVSRHEGKFTVARCSEPQLEMDESRLVFPELDYQTRRYERSKTAYARRLRSAWGPHWRWEEESLAHGNISNVLLVCKRMLLDVADTSTLHITGLETVNSLDKSDIAETKFSAAFLFHSITQLNITLRLPLPFCNALERTYDSHTLESGSEIAGDTKAWFQLGTTLTQLKKLRTLRIWLDHDEPCSWSVVHERAILSCLNPLYAIEGLDISISLPKLHPKYEDKDRHFVEGSHIPFRLIRRLRQSDHAQRTDSQDGFEIITQLDFPVSIELQELTAELSQELTAEVGQGPHVTLAEMQEEERRQWMSGRDVEAETKEMLAEISSCSLVCEYYGM